MPHYMQPVNYETATVASFMSFTISWLPNKDEIKSTYRWISRSDSWNIVLRNLSFYVPLACNRITQYGKVTNGENAVRRGEK